MVGENASGEGAINALTRYLLRSVRDYYSELGVPMDADPVAITKAFRILAMDLHPDRNDAPDAVERFIAIREAFELLIDPSKRRIYDDLRRREAAVGAVSTVDPQKEQYEQWRSDARHRGRRDSEGHTMSLSHG